MSDYFPGLDVDLPQRGADCPPALVLEAHVAGPADARVAEHLKSCEACGGYCSALEHEQEAFRRAARPAAFLEQVEARRRARSVVERWRRALAGLGVIAAVSAALVFVLVRPQPAERARFKGGAFSVVYLRAGMREPRVVEPSMRLRAEDALRFFYRSPRGGQLAILDRDGQGGASVLFPFGGGSSSAVEPDRSGPLPPTVVLDAARGPEFILAVFCPRPFETSPLLGSLRSAPLKDPPHLELPGCEVEALRIEKEVP